MTVRRVERDAVESTAAGTGDELRMGNLLDRWEEAQERGQPCDLESLCADCPELLDAYAGVMNPRPRNTALLSFVHATTRSHRRKPPRPWPPSNR